MSYLLYDIWYGTKPVQNLNEICYNLNMVATQPKYELITYNGHNEQYVGKKVRLYPDGSIRNDRGYFVEKHPDTVPITHENARAFAQRNVELKRQVAQEAANNAVQRGDFKIAYGDMAFVAELVDAAQRKATNIDDPKMIDAARFVMSATGYDDRQATDDQKQANEGALAALGAELVRHLTDRARDARENS